MRRVAGWLLAGFGLVGLAVEAEALIAGTSSDLLVGLVLSGLFIAGGVALVRSGLRTAPAPAPRPLAPDILKMARDNGGRLGVVEVAAQLGAPLEEVEASLRRLLAQGACEELVTDSGVSIFRFPELDGRPDAKRDLLETGGSGGA